MVRISVQLTLMLLFSKIDQCDVGGGSTQVSQHSGTSVMAKKWALSYSQRRISLKRSISNNWQAQKKIIYQIAVVPVKGTYPQSLSQNTGIKSLSLKRYEEASVMTIDPKVTFPIYISCNFLFYTPSTEPSAAAVINAPQPPPNLSV